MMPYKFNSNAKLFVPVQEGTGTSVEDRATGVPFATQSTVSWINGPVGKALQMESISAGLLRNSVSLGIGAEATIRMMFRYQAIAGHLFQLVNYDNVVFGPGTRVYCNTTQLVVVAYNSTYFDEELGDLPAEVGVGINHSLTAGQWYMLHVVFPNDGSAYAYINGALLGSGSIAGSVGNGFSNGTARATWGRAYGSDSYNGGAISHCCLFDRAFTANEVSADYFGGV